MNNPEPHPVFSDQVISFVRSANQFCTFLSAGPQAERGRWVRESRIALLKLYHDFSMVPAFEPGLDEPLEKFVTEDDWIRIRNGIIHLLGRFNDYLEVFDEGMQENERPVVRSIADDLSDIYQDVQDFVSLYNIGTTEIMNDALAECQEHFILYWGQKAVNVLKALHNLEFGEEDLDAGEEGSGKEAGRDTDNWFITRRMKEYRDEEEDRMP